MIITCPECATRYDVDDERFSSTGRSVRCTACGEAWFVPAPEPIDVDPIEELTPAKRAPQRPDRGKPKRGGPPTEGHFEAPPGRNERTRQVHEDRREDGGNSFADDNFDDDEEDSLFDSPPMGKTGSVKGVDADDGNVEAEEDRGGFHGFGFAARRFGRSRGRDDDVERGGSGSRDDLDDRAPPFIKHQSRKERENRERHDHHDDREMRNAPEDVVDADWEDVDDSAATSQPEADRAPAPEAAVDGGGKTSGDRRRGFGRRAADHLKSESTETANRREGGSEIARLADVSPFDPEEFDDEFFTALQVTPKALARALKKTRRRAESRRKNRLTPFRAFGWTIWLAAVAGAAYGVVAYRDEIVKMAPKTADAYAIIGIEANPFGLTIENVEHRLAMSTAGPTIEISGKLKNMGDASVAAPLLQAEALGPRGKLLSRWTFSPEETEVLEGATIDFITRAPAPDGVAEVALSFAPTKSPVSEFLSGRE